MKPLSSLNPGLELIGITCTYLLTSLFQTNVTSVTVCTERRTVMKGTLCALLCGSITMLHRAAADGAPECGC